VRRAVLTIIRQWHSDFGPTFAAEKLHEDHGIALRRETLRQWMMEAGLWRDRKQRKRIQRAAAAVRMRRRTGAGRRQRALVARGPRAAMHAAGVCRRRDRPTDASAICRERIDLCLFLCGPRLSGGLRQAGRAVQRQHRRRLSRRLATHYCVVELTHRTFDKVRQVSQAAIVDNKQLGAALAFIRDQRLRREPERRSRPRGRDQSDACLFEVG
jgi:hypothetical protein